MGRAKIISSPAMQIKWLFTEYLKVRQLQFYTYLMSDDAWNKNSGFDNIEIFLAVWCFTHVKLSNIFYINGVLHNGVVIVLEFWCLFNLLALVE